MFSTVVLCHESTGSGIGSVNPAVEGEDHVEPSSILSGLYSYHIPTSTWKKLRNNRSEPQPRIGHSMLFHPVRSCASCLVFVLTLCTIYFEY